MEDDSHILREEIRLIEEPFSDKKEIMLRAAQKLERLPENIHGEKTHTVSKRISIAFKEHVSSRYIRRILPEKYKHQYKKKQHLQKSPVEEALYWQTEALKKFREVAQELHDEIKNDPEKAKIAEKVNLHKSLKILADKTLRPTLIMEEINERLDKTRETKRKPKRKLKTRHKMILPVLLSLYTRGKVAKRLKVSPKWVKKIEEEDRFIKFMKHGIKCEKCGASFVKWLEEEKARVASGKKPRVPKDILAIIDNYMNKRDTE